MMTTALAVRVLTRSRPRGTAPSPTPRYETSIGVHFVIGKDERLRLGHVDAAGNDLGGYAEPIMMTWVSPRPRWAR